MHEDKRVYVYDRAGEYQGYVRLDQDDAGQPVGEVYDTEANKLGAIRIEPLENTAEESLVYDPEGRQIGTVRLERYDNDMLGGDIYWGTISESKSNLLLHVHYDPASGKQAEVHKKAQWGEEAGSLKPEGSSPEEVILGGGGAALLILR